MRWNVTFGGNVLVMSRQWAHTQGCAMAQAVKPHLPLGLHLIPGQSVWKMWCIKWQWGRFFSKYLGFLLSVSFHRCNTHTSFSSH